MAGDFLFRKELISSISNFSSNAVYIYGPSGFGKSVLARQYVETSSIPYVWFDASATTTAKELLLDLTAAVIKTFPELETDLKFFAEKSSFEVADVTTYFKVIEKHKKPFNLVIDGAQEISAKFNDIAREFLQKLPKHVKVLMIRSYGPTIPYLLNFGLDKFLIISPEQLRFSVEEFKQFATQVDSKISDSDLERLYELTEGWPQVAELIFEISRNLDNREFDELIRQLKKSGKQRIENLAHKVLALCNPEEIATLLAVALFQEIEAEKVLAITEDVNSVEHLIRLANDSIILTEIDHNPPRFKMNQIVREALLGELRKSGRFTEILDKTFRILKDRSDIRNLITVLIEAGEVQKLTEILNSPSSRDLIDEAVSDSLRRSAVGEVRQWIRLSAYASSYSEFATNLLSFYAELIDGNLSLATGYLEELKTLVSSESEYQEFKGDVLAAESVYAFMHGDLQRNKKLALAAYKERSNSKIKLRGHQISYLQLASWSAHFSDDDEVMQEISQIVEKISASELNLKRKSDILAIRAVIYAHQGRYKDAASCIAGTSPFYDLSKSQGLFGSYGIRFVKSVLMHESGKLAEATTLIEENLKESLKYKVWPVAVASYCRLSYMHTIEHRFDAALENVASARALIDMENLSSELHQIVDLVEARLRLFTMENDRAQDLLKRIPETYLVRALKAAILIGKESPKAGELIDSFDLEMPKQAFTYHLFKAHLLKDAPNEQYREVRKAVEIGSSNGYFYHFLTQRSDVMNHYLTLASEHPTVFNENLARVTSERLNFILRNNSATESLTRREADILRHLATGLPIKQIAANLNISKNTIKTHLRNLYKKLGATDRDDAVAKGRDLLRV